MCAAASKEAWQRNHSDKLCFKISFKGNTPIPTPLQENNINSSTPSFFAAGCVLFLWVFAKDFFLSVQTIGFDSIPQQNQRVIRNVSGTKKDTQTQKRGVFFPPNRLKKHAMSEGRCIYIYIPVLNRSFFWSSH